MAGTWLLGAGAETSRQRPTAVLVAVHEDGGAGGNGPGSEVSLEELRRLADTDGLSVAEAVVQNRPKPDPATYLGSGKVDELAAAAERVGAEVVIADGELTPGQVRNLEERVGVRVVDRTALILDIFAEHARTSEGRVQVELAQIAYQLPRLRGDCRGMSRVGGRRVRDGAGIRVG
ncbi:GTPase HflX, partial [Micromonospora sp. CPCC 205714]